MCQDSGTCEVTRLWRRREWDDSWWLMLYTSKHTCVCIYRYLYAMCILNVDIYNILCMYLIYICLKCMHEKDFPKRTNTTKLEGWQFLFYFIRNHCLDELGFFLSGYFSWNRTPMAASYRLVLLCLKSTPCPKIMQSTHLSSWGVFFFWQSCHHCHKGTLWSIDLQRPSSAFALEIRSWRWRLGQTPTRWSAWGEGRWQ